MSETNSIIRPCKSTNAELEEAVRFFQRVGGYQKDIERITELLDRRRAMGYDPQPAPDPEADAERTRRQNLLKQQAQIMRGSTDGI